MDDLSPRYQPSAMRASDADRDAVLAELSEHFQAGRLTHEEFDERSDLVLRAKTYGELADLTRDLPALRRLPAPSVKPPFRATGPRLPVAAVTATILLIVLVVGTISRDAVVGRAVLSLWWLVLIVPFVASRGGRGRR
ncbi:MAG TPA: DUF1707 domain-containing protein [Streptosporangiaceae bacterium]|nr:DUF1707 domain-containing protein [Streptosporangiaceae bacterium]